MQQTHSDKSLLYILLIADSTTAARGKIDNIFDHNK